MTPRIACLTLLECGQRKSVQPKLWIRLLEVGEFWVGYYVCCDIPLRWHYNRCHWKYSHTNNKTPKTGNSSSSIHTRTTCIRSVSTVCLAPNDHRAMGRTGAQNNRQLFINSSSSIVSALRIFHSLSISCYSIGAKNF